MDYEQGYERRRPLRIAAWLIVVACVVIGLVPALRSSSWRSTPPEDRREVCQVERVAGQTLLCKGRPEVLRLSGHLDAVALVRPGEEVTLSCTWMDSPEGMHRSLCEVVEVHPKP